MTQRSWPPGDRPPCPLLEVRDADLERLSLGELRSRCRKALFSAARSRWSGPRPELRRAVRGFVRGHRSDRGALTSVLRSVASSSALAVALMEIAPPAEAAVIFEQRVGAQNPLDGFDAGSRSAPVFVDIDGDGRIDAFAGTSAGTFGFFENTGSAASPAFVERTGGSNPLDGFSAGSSSKPAIADVDDDGDFDVFSGSNAGTVAFFENTGSAASPAFIERTGSLNPLAGFDLGVDSAPALADVDDDGDLDSVVGAQGLGYLGYFAYFENTGTAASPAFVLRTGSESPLDGFSGGGSWVPTFADVDDDGDFDILAGHTIGMFSFFENTGSAGAPAFVEHTAGALNPVAGFDVGLRSAPTVADIDDDGDLDLQSGADDGTFAFFENTGSASDVVHFVAATGGPPLLVGAGVSVRSKAVLADLDADGDLDVVHGHPDGTLSFFENTGSAVSPAFVERTGTQNPLDGFDVYNVSAPALVDIDADGDFDVFAGGYEAGYIFPGAFAFFENTGSAASPSFVERSGSQNPLDGFQVGADSTPAFADLDDDGDFDAFSGSSYGTFAFFENTGSAAAPAFVERTGAQNPLAGFDLSISVPAFGDIDADGDLDVFSGDSGGTFAFFENTGSAGSPGFVERSGSLNPLFGFGVFSYSAPSLADIDDDGDLDVLSGAAAFFENTGSAASPMFVPTADGNPLAGFDVGARSAPRFVDIDADGDSDAFSGSEAGTFAHFENAGSATSPAFVTRVGPLNPLDGFDVGSNSTPAFGDVDDDADFDAVAGNAAGTLAWFENTGSAASPQFLERSGSQNPLDGFDVGSDSAPALGDIDDDGDLDVLSGELLGAFAFFENTGSAVSPAFVERTGSQNPLDGFDVGTRAAPSFVDLDGDGDLDVFSGDSGGTIAYFENTGSPASPAFVERAGGVLHPLAGFLAQSPSAPALVDIDDDGDLDAVTGSFVGSFGHYENVTPPAVPVTPPGWLRWLAGAVVLAAAWRRAR